MMPIAATPRTERRRPLPGPDATREVPIAAWLHIGGISQGTVAVTIPGTHKAMSLTRTQVSRLRRALVEAEAIFARDEAPATHQSVDLMRLADTRTEPRTETQRTAA